MNKKEESKIYTTAAFLLGIILTDNLTSTEQNAVGNWLMLVAQTLCTNGSYTFNKDWKGHLNEGHTDIRSMLNVMKKSLDKVSEIIK